MQDPNTVFSKKQKQKNGMSQQMIHHKWQKAKSKEQHIIKFKQSED